MNGGGSGSVYNENTEDSKKIIKMRRDSTSISTSRNHIRSSIACTRCRKSKIKCTNTGPDEPCKPCITASRECVYPTPATSTSGPVKRAEPSNGSARPEGDGEFKRARKRETETARRQSVRHDGDALESPPITMKLWKDVYNSFMLHCSPDLPFLHEETFLARVRQPSAERTKDTRIFLLSILGLTARFIPELVSYHNPSEPLAASEFYADAFQASLDVNDLVGNGPSSLERIHGFLMICLYHWGMWRGPMSWKYLTIARGHAQILKLMFEEELIPGDKSGCLPLQQGSLQLDARQGLISSRAKDDTLVNINREIKRRTVYSIFILDRYLASGRFRPQGLRIEDVEVQLPCSEEDFRFGTTVKTGLLKPETSPRIFDDVTPLYSIPVDATMVLGLYIELVEIWGRASKWFCSGGRLKEHFPPWDERTEVYKLCRQLDDFQESLPPKLTYGHQIMAAHIGMRTSTIYASIHALFLLCNIVLHREYIPFAPFKGRCPEPMGPIDEPVFPREEYNDNNWWKESAENVFRSAKEIMEIVRDTSERGVLVESPMMVFAIYTAAFVGVYSNNFPHMDVSYYMCDKPPNSVVRPDRDDWTGAASLAVRTLKQMESKMKMAVNWGKSIEQRHRYYVRMRREYEHFVVPRKDRKPSIHDGGGGLPEYKLLEKELKDFGPDLDEERYSTPLSDRPSTRASGTPHLKHESLPITAAKNMHEVSWAAVNSPSSNGGDDHRSHPGSHGNFNATGIHSTTYYPRSSMSNTTGLVSPTNTRSITSDNSPYTRPDTVHSDAGYGNPPPNSLVSSAAHSQPHPHPQTSYAPDSQVSSATAEQNFYDRISQVQNELPNDVAEFGEGVIFEPVQWSQMYAQSFQMHGNESNVHYGHDTSTAVYPTPQQQAHGSNWGYGN